MARISTYAIDGTPVSSDKLIGTDSSGTTTKNYPLGSVSDWLKESGASAVLGQNNYSFQIALDPDAGRLPGSFSFENYGGDGTEFLDISRLMVSNLSSTGKYVGDYLLSIVGDRVMLGQLDDLNSFGVYTLVSLVQNPIEPTFYDAELLFVEGNGALLGNKLYGLATYSASASAESAVWGSIEGTVTNQTDLVDYIDAEIAAIPVPATPTLQTVTDEGNTTTNNIGIGTATPGAKLDVNGTTYLRSVALNTVFGYSGNNIQFINTGNTTFAGNVGIGTTAPTDKLEVVSSDNIGTTKIVSAVSLSGSQRTSLGYNSVMGSHSLRLESQASSLNVSTKTAHPIVFNTNNTEVARITDTGNVGIGTTAPTRNLEVSSSGTTTLRIGSTNSFGRGIELYTTGSSTFLDVEGNFSIRKSDSNPLWTADGTVTIANQYFYGGYINFRKRNTTTNLAQIGLEDGSNTYFNTGNVGIGTTAPAAKLEVHQSADSQGLKIVGFDNEDNSNLHLFVDNFGNGKINSTEFLQINAGGSSRYRTTGYLRLEVGGTSNQLQIDYNYIKFTSGGTETMRITPGKVGIGTTSPRELLEITKFGNPANIRLNQSGGTIGIGDVLGSIQFSGEDVQVPTDQQVGASISGVSEWSWGAGTEARTALVFSTRRTESQAPTERMRLNYLGNLGIGTTAPTEKLQVSGGNILLDTNTWIGSGSGSGQPRLRFDNTNSQGKLQQADLVLNDEKSVAWSNTGTSIQGRGTDNQRIEFNVASSERMRITDTGNVGIGTTTPDGILHVYNPDDSGSNRTSVFEHRWGVNALSQYARYGAIVKSADLNTSLGVTNQAYNTVLQGFQYVSPFTAKGISLNPLGGAVLVGRNAQSGDVDPFLVNSTSAGDAFIVKENGNVGIGTTAPTEKLHVDGNIRTSSGTGLGVGIDTIYSNSVNINNSGQYRIGNAEFISKSANNMNIYQGKMWVTDTGNVGIGTTAPAYKLDVNGDARVDNYLRFSSAGTYLRNNSSGALVLAANSGYIETGWGARFRVRAQSGSDTIMLYGGGDSYINGGNLGIGTTAPDSKLHVSAASGIAFKVNPNNVDKEWYIDTTNPDHLKKEGNLILNADPTGVHTGTKISFNIDGSNKANINSDGDLGVGTTAQTSKVHVDGTAMRQLRMGTAGGPSSNTDTSGAVGDMAYDDDFFYIKTANGWGRVQLDFGF